MTRQYYSGTTDWFSSAEGRLNMKPVSFLHTTTSACRKKWKISYWFCHLYPSVPKLQDKFLLARASTTRGGGGGGWVDGRAAAPRNRN